MEICISNKYIYNFIWEIDIIHILMTTQLTVTKKSILEYVDKAR
jgi:hypothetical protein